MNKIIEEMQQIATFFTGKQKEVYQEMINDAREAEIVPMSEVFTEKEINMIRKIVRPKQHECYKNAFRLTTLFFDRVKYCEGKMSVKGIVSIEHAWNKIDGKYVDITRELVLGDNVEENKEDYVSFLEIGAEELLDVSSRMEFYGGVYQFMKSEKK